VREEILAVCCRWVRLGITVGGDSFRFAESKQMEADCWGLSMEEMDSLELHAIKQLAERRSNNTGVPSSSSSPTSASSSAAALKKQHFQQPSPSKSSGNNVPPSLHVKLFKEQAGGGGQIGVQTQYNKVNPPFTLTITFMRVTGLEENVPLIVCGRIFLAKRKKKKRIFVGRMSAASDDQPWKKHISDFCCINFVILFCCSIL